jgi:glutathione S-transferase
MQAWYRDALAESWREIEHEDHTKSVGTWVEDLRAK